MLELTTLGRLSIKLNGVELPHLLTQRQKIGLLCYLAVEGPTPREKLVTLFWGERDENRARHALSQALYALRGDLSEGALQTTSESIGLAADSLMLDIATLQQSLQKEDWAAIIKIYGGSFLDGFYLPDAPAFGEWQSRTRAWASNVARRAFRNVLAQRSAAHDVTGALACAHRWAELEPLEDEAQHALVSLFAASGNRPQAIAQYEAYRLRLARELDLEPLAETTALVESIRAGNAVAPSLIGSSTAATPGAAAAPVVHGTTAPSQAVAAPATAHTIEEQLQEVLRPRLQLLRKINQSRTSIIYLAREPELDRSLAVKVFLPTVAGDRRAKLRFQREMMAVASLNEPHIVSLHWAGELPSGAPYFVMQYVDGRSLAQVLQLEGRVPVKKARALLAQLAAALAAAHRRGIVHRGVQPSNVLIEDKTERLFLTDFGTAALLAGNEAAGVSLTLSGELIGDPEWMSPEQLECREITTRTDIYNFGLLGYYLLAEEGPYERTAKGLAFLVGSDVPPRPLKSLRPDADNELAELLENCLAREPHRRPSAAHLAGALLTPDVEIRFAIPAEHRADLVQLKVPHMFAAYFVVGLSALELIELAVDRGILLEGVLRGALIGYVLAAPLIPLLAWYRRKRLSRSSEMLL